MYSKKNYEVAARLLAGLKSTDERIEIFVKEFEKDNEKFNKVKFINYIKEARKKLKKAEKGNVFEDGYFLLLGSPNGKNIRCSCVSQCPICRKSHECTASSPDSKSLKVGVIHD